MRVRQSLLARRVFLAEEGAFQRERIHDIKLLEYDDSGRLLFARLYPKPATLQLEQSILLATQERDNPELRILDPALVLIVLVAAPIEEGVLLSGVAVQIAK